jgi:transcriptional regulator with XRE-family HTH domain
MEKTLNPKGSQGEAGEKIRKLRARAGFTLKDVSAATGLAVSTLSKIEKGRMSLSFDKLTLISRALDVDIAEVLNAELGAEPRAGSGVGRRVVERAGEGRRVETHSYKQFYMATELLHKRFTPIVVEICSRSLDEFIAEFGALIRHPGEEYTFVVEGELEFHSELYAPVRLRAGDSIYFDSDMGHAYLRASQGPCRIVCVCAGRGKDDSLIQKFAGLSERSQAASPAASVVRKRRL